MIKHLATHSFLNKSRCAALFALLCTSLTACASLPSQTVYVLDIVRSEEAGTKSVQDLPVLEIAPVILPVYLDTTDIVQRKGAQIIASPTGRWGDRLSVELTRSLAAYIASDVPNMTITMNALSQHPQYRLLINVEAFEMQSSNEVKLAAHWILLDEGAHKTLAVEKTVAVEKTQDTSDANIVAAMDRTTMFLSKQITRQIAIIPSKPLRYSR